MTESNQKRTYLIRQQNKKVMPLIGTLLEKWDNLPNDVKSDPELDDLVEIIRKIDDAMEGK